MTDVVVDNNTWELTVADLSPFSDTDVERKEETLEQLGGIAGIARGVGSDLENGLSADEETTKFQTRTQQYGTNFIPKKKAKNIIQLFFEAWKDEMLIILTIAAIIALIFGVAFPEDGNRGTGWIDGFAILMAVFIVCTVTAVQDWHQERNFRELNAKKDDIPITVVRGGEQKKVSVLKLLVGDVVVFGNGDKVPADGLLIKGSNIEVDEASVTGESVPSHKTDIFPYMISGCLVTDGEGTMLVTATGVNSLWGKTLAALVEDDEETPLQKKLGKVARYIGIVGFIVAAVVFFVLMVYWTYDVIVDGFAPQSLILILKFFIIAVTIVVVAVPEGLPLAVIIALSYSVKKMKKDNNFVRKTKACETMGGATNICSDKTGTLTQNRMTVVRGFQAGEYFDSVPPPEIKADSRDIIWKGICWNSSVKSQLKDPNSIEKAEEDVETFCCCIPKPAGGIMCCCIPKPKFLQKEKEEESWSQKWVFAGNPTECALLAFVEECGDSYQHIRDQSEGVIKKRWPFNSKKKRMSILAEKEGGGYRMYCKGAAEVIISRCTSILGENGASPMDDSKKDELENFVEEMACQGLRCLCLAYRDFETFDLDDKEDEDMDDEEERIEFDQKMTLTSIFGIEDPLRPEVPNAVKICQGASIIVRMVTGDNIKTASKIAEDCGILTEKNKGHKYACMLGEDFRNLPDDVIDTEVLPNLMVLARSSPADKLRLVERLKHQKFLTAVTGDGTNDAPALHKAHVGCAMGDGTEVAKEASDIIIMDNSFNSIVKAVMWGRCIFDNIRKFLQFQLTVNVGALAIAFIGAVTRVGTPLKAVQLLWVNLIMDAMGALALATEAPTPDLLNRKPINVAHSKTSLISYKMWVNIMGQSMYQVGVICVLLFAAPYLLPTYIPRHDDVHFTMIFNTFVWCQIFNEINSRKVNGELNIFAGFFTNGIFMAIIVITALLQVFIVEVAGPIFHTVHLGPMHWVICIAIGFVGLIVGFFLRLVARFMPDDKDYSGVPDDFFDAEFENQLDEEEDEKEEEK